jgi:hypothetical protein
MKITLLGALIVSSLLIAEKDKLTGRWESKPSEKGNVTGVVFKSDNSFEGYVNRKPFVTGSYTLEDGIFSFIDNGCDGKRGTYKLILFSNEDSVKFEPIMDSCEERKKGMTRLVMGRVK